MTKCRNLVILGWIHSSKCMRNKVILTSIKNLGHSPFLERTCLRIPVKNHVDRFRRVFGAVLLQQKNFTIYWGSVRASRSHGTRFSGSSAKRAFHLSCHDRKVEGAHWVVFFGTSFLLTTSQNPQTETLNRFPFPFRERESAFWLMVRRWFRSHVRTLPLPITGLLTLSGVNESSSGKKESLQPSTSIRKASAITTPDERQFDVRITCIAMCAGTTNQK